MNTFTKFAVSLIALVALALSVAAFTKTPQIIDNTTTPPAGSAGAEASFHYNFYDNMTLGGTDFSTTSQGTATYSALQIVNARVIEHVAPAALTVTLPTGAQLSSAGFLPKVGDTQSFWIHASTTAITLAGGSGMNFFSASSTKQIAAGSMGRVECIRLGASEARLIQCILVAD